MGELVCHTSSADVILHPITYELAHHQLLKSLNAYAILLTLLLIASYSGFRQVPNSLDGSQSSNSSTFLKIFIYTNGCSFFSSVAALLLFASASFSPLSALEFRDSRDAEKDVEKSVQLLALTLPKFFNVILLFGVSLTALVFAYIFAGLSILPNAISEQLPVIVTAVIGGSIYLQAMFVCAQNSYQLLKGSIKQNDKLWNAFKNGTWFGLWLGQYMEFLCQDAAVKNRM